MRKDVVDLLKGGFTPKEIKQRISGVSSELISRYRARIGLPKFKGGPTGPLEPKRMQAAIKEARRLKIVGYTYKQIGTVLGVSRQRAQQYLKVSKGANKNAACQECGKSGVVLHCHHEDYAIESIKLLCVSCHNKHHPLKKGLSKLSAEQVRNIRRETGTVKEIGKRFNVSSQLVSRIIKRETWKWLK